MAVTLHERAHRFARRLVAEGRAVHDERDDWSEHQPSVDAENAFIARHGFGAYGEWHLGADDAHAPDTKAHWKYPFGDFERVHRCGLLAAESRAGRNKHLDVERAAHELHGLIERVED
jgi:hypothetical protein